MSIYTKRGDRGKTSLFLKSGCDLVWKDEPRVEALGAIDEVNSFLGIIVAETEDEKLKEILQDVQRNLLTIGSIIGGSDLSFPKSKTTKMEKLIDELEKNLPALKNFILPGGGKTAAKLHYARALTRRAERYVVSLNKKEKIKSTILTYLNRLSDALFVLARNENFKAGIKDEIWTVRKV